MYINLVPAPAAPTVRKKSSQAPRAGLCSTQRGSSACPAALAAGSAATGATAPPTAPYATSAVSLSRYARAGKVRRLLILRRPKCMKQRGAACSKMCRGAADLLMTPSSETPSDWAQSDQCTTGDALLSIRYVEQVPSLSTDSSAVRTRRPRPPRSRARYARARPRAAPLRRHRRHSPRRCAARSC